MKTPSKRALLFGMLPLAATCFSVPLWDRVDPMLFGLPFNLFWLMVWLVLSPCCVWAAYRTETARSARERIE